MREGYSATAIPIKRSTYCSTAPATPRGSNDKTQSEKKVITTPVVRLERPKFFGMDIELAPQMAS